MILEVDSILSRFIVFISFYFLPGRGRGWTFQAGGARTTYSFTMNGGDGRRCRFDA